MFRSIELRAGRQIDDRRTIACPNRAPPLFLCPNCQTERALARIMPGLPGFDLRYFDCSNCGAVVKMTVDIAPAKTEKMTE
jgi:DNA polymerase III alpha subunit (gram-positive type)